MNPSPDPNAPASGGSDGWVADRLARRWKSIALCGVAGVVAACLYTSARPPEYIGHMSVFFPSRPSVLGSNDLVQSGGGGAAAALLTGGAPSPLRVFEAFLSSETALRLIVRENGLKRERYLAKRSVDSDPRASLLTITYADSDKQRNIAVLRSNVRVLGLINRKVEYDTSVNDRSVLRRRLDAARADLKKREQDLVGYQRTLVSAPSVVSQGGVIAATPGNWSSTLASLQVEAVRLDSALATSKERIRLLATLPREIQTELPPIKRLTPDLQDAEYQLAEKRLTLGPESRQIVLLEKRVEAIRAQMEKEIHAYLQGIDRGIIDPTSTAESSTGGSVGGNLPQLSQLLTQRVVNAAQIAVLTRLAKVAPSEAVNLNRRYREITLAAQTVQQLTTQTLQAGIQSQRDPNRWVILDDPWVDEKPSNKSYTRMGLAGGLVGLVLGGFVALAWRDRRR